ncbi:hypothetical protein EWM64_g6426 [Hericium alpestre]|uniref:Uncharacterized protein n=1 Tax=Hericium alpestre TaxID=135208 RepID=A0A4Y9ZVS7_9AGAM|nr:hypothetical protein EWM64_g6426 [Hericium alpestre]
MSGRESLHIAQSGKDTKLHDALVEFKARLGIDEEPQYFTSREEPPKSLWRRPVQKREVDKLLNLERFLEPLTEIPSDVSSFPAIKSRVYPEGGFDPVPRERTPTGQDEKSGA